MAYKVYELAVKIGEYEAKDGTTKGRWQNVGAVIQGENGKFLSLNRWFNPAGVPNPEGRDNVLISMFTPNQNQSQGGNQQQGNNQSPDSEPDIPF